MNGLSGLSGFDFDAAEAEMLNQPDSSVLPLFGSDNVDGSNILSVGRGLVLSAEALGASFSAQPAVSQQRPVGDRSERSTGGGRKGWGKAFRLRFTSWDGSGGAAGSMGNGLLESVGEGRVGTPQKQATAIEEEKQRMLLGTASTTRQTPFNRQLSTNTDDQERRWRLIGGLAAYPGGNKGR
jgi:hypothetical protein